jgi:hypothetical protein
MRDQIENHKNFDKKAKKKKEIKSRRTKLKIIVILLL